MSGKLKETYAYISGSKDVQSNILSLMESHDASFIKTILAYNVSNLTKILDRKKGEYVDTATGLRALLDIANVKQVEEVTVTTDFLQKVLNQLEGD